MFGRKKKKKDPPPPHAGCGHTDEEHRAIFRKILCGEIEDATELESDQPESPILPLPVTGSPMRGLNAWH